MSSSAHLVPLWFFLLVFWLYQIVDLWTRNSESNAVSFGNPWLGAGLNAILVVGVAVAVILSGFKLLRGGRVAEGLVVGASDDGIDRLYTVY